MPPPEPIPLPPANAPEPSAPSLNEEPTPMLDVHPAHHAATTWRDFFIHIATIVLGLLIAIGLEQTVEYFHHRHQIAETRELLRNEREDNRQALTRATKSFRVVSAELQNNLQVLTYLQQHPGTSDEKLRHSIVDMGKPSLRKRCLGRGPEFRRH